MVSNNSIPNQGSQPTLYNWRTQLDPKFRQIVVNTVKDILQKHHPDNGKVELKEVEKEVEQIAQKFEYKIYTAAISQCDYVRKFTMKMRTMPIESQSIIAGNILPSQGNFGIAPTSVPVSDALRNQNSIWLNSTYQNNIPAEASSSTVPLEQEEESDRFKRKRVSLGYSSEWNMSEIPKDPSTTMVIHDNNNLFLQSEDFNFAGQVEPSKVVSLDLENVFDAMATNAMWLNSAANEAKGVFKTWSQEKMKYEEDLQRLTDELVKRDELIAQLKEENINLVTKSEREKYELSIELELSKKACENAEALLNDANKSLEEVGKKNSDL